MLKSRLEGSFDDRTRRTKWEDLVIFKRSWTKLSINCPYFDVQGWVKWEALVSECRALGGLSGSQQEM